MDRLKERITIAREALLSLFAALREQKTPITRDATIQRFEYTFEALWKAAQLHLRIVESLEVGSPKAAIRASMSNGLLNEVETRHAMSMADDRNLTVHTYNEKLAEQIYARIGDHARVMESWLTALERSGPGGAVP